MLKFSKILLPFLFVMAFFICVNDARSAYTYDIIQLDNNSSVGNYDYIVQSFKPNTYFFDGVIVIATATSTIEVDLCTTPPTDAGNFQARITDCINGSSFVASSTCSLIPGTNSCLFSETADMTPGISYGILFWDMDTNQFYDQDSGDSYADGLCMRGHDTWASIGYCSNDSGSDLYFKTIISYNSVAYQMIWENPANEELDLDERVLEH